MFTIVKHSQQTFVIDQALQTPTADFKGNELHYYYTHAIAGFYYGAGKLTAFSCGDECLELTICRQYTDAQLITLAQAMQQIMAISANNATPHQRQVMAERQRLATQ